MTYEAHLSNLIEGLKMQVTLGNWVKVASLADDLRILEAEHEVRDSLAGQSGR